MNDFQIHPQNYLTTFSKRKKSIYNTTQNQYKKTEITTLCSQVIPVFALVSGLCVYILLKVDLIVYCCCNVNK